MGKLKIAAGRAPHLRIGAGRYKLNLSSRQVKGNGFFEKERFSLMCGRFALYSPLPELVETFDVQEVRTHFEPSYNIAPTHQVAVVVKRETANVLETMTWGLIPFWAKDPKIGSRMINARAETLSQKPSFKRPLKTQRCLIVADGFFEWAKTGQAKVPMFIRAKSKRPFGFAGLYDTWQSPAGEAVTSCTIVTTQANEFMQPIHSRMPLILADAQQADWLDLATDNIDEWLAGLRPYPGHEMEAYEVSRRVNSPAHNDVDCVQPISQT
jgi:putative SOS response-associated peptidase YedK